MISAPVPGINLLSKKKLVIDERRTLSTKIKKGAVVVLVVYGIILAIVVGVNVWMTQSLNKIKMDQEKVKTVLINNTVLVSQYDLVTSKVGMITELMTERKEVVDLWQQLQALIPEGCSMTRFSIDEDVLMVGIDAPHVVLANQALNVIEPALPYLGATKTTASISRSEDASYKLDFELDLNTATKKE